MEFLPIKQVVLVFIVSFLGAQLVMVYHIYQYIFKISLKNEGRCNNTHTQICCITSINLKGMKGRGNVTLKMKPHNTHTDIDITKRFAFTRAVKFQCLRTTRPLQDGVARTTEFQQLRVYITTFLIWRGNNFSLLLSCYV